MTFFYLRMIVTASFAWGENNAQLSSRKDILVLELINPILGLKSWSKREIKTADHRCKDSPSLMQSE
jgi:hypothetical protein